MTIGTHIGYGFYRIGLARARKLAGGKLPRPSYERLIVVPGEGHCWLSRTTDGGRWVWSIRRAWGWKLVDGQAVSDPDDRRPFTLGRMTGPPVTVCLGSL